MPPPNHRSGEHDAALILAIRQEVEAALLPVREQLNDIGQRLAGGDTKFALFEQRLGGIEHQCRQHREPRTDKAEKKREMNPILLALFGGAVGAVGAVTATWILVGIGQQAAKGAP